MTLQAGNPVIIRAHTGSGMAIVVLVHLTGRYTTNLMGLLDEIEINGASHFPGRGSIVWLKPEDIYTHNGKRHYTKREWSAFMKHPQTRHSGHP